MSIAEADHCYDAFAEVLENTVGKFVGDIMVLKLTDPNEGDETSASLLKF